jgi:hypothetical protein
MFIRDQPIVKKTPTVIVPPITRAAEVIVRIWSGLGQLYGEPDTRIAGQRASNSQIPRAMMPRGRRVMMSLSV